MVDCPELGGFPRNFLYGATGTNELKSERITTTVPEEPPDPYKLLKHTSRQTKLFKFAGYVAAELGHSDPRVLIDLDHIGDGMLTLERMNFSFLWGFRRAEAFVREAARKIRGGADGWINGIMIMNTNEEDSDVYVQFVRTTAHFIGRAAINNDERPLSEKLDNRKLRQLLNAQPRLYQALWRKNRGR